MTPSRGGLTILLALLVVVSSFGAAVQPAAAANQKPGDVFTDAVQEQRGIFGGFNAGDDVPLTGEGHPYWTVQYENGSADNLRAWANASRSRTIRSHDSDSRIMVISAPPRSVGASKSVIYWTSTPLYAESYVEAIGLRRTVEIDPITTPDLKDKSAWSKPAGYELATWGGYNGKLNPDGTAWGDEVNTSTLDEARASIGADVVAGNGSGIRVAVLDTGLDYKEELYQDRVVAGKNVLTNETLNTSKSYENRSYDKVADGSSSNHGSWVATAIAGNGSGPNATGVAPGADLVPVKVLADDGSGTTDHIAQGLEYACEEANADVVSMSLGSPLASMQIEKEIQECLEDNDVSAVVVAAGNNRLTTRYVQSPGDSDRVITVSASDARTINESESAYFSAVGPDPETGKEPDVSAPGLKVTAEVAEGNRTLSGTSMATPIVSGTIALTLESQSELRGDSDAVHAYVTEHAEPMPEAGVTEVGAGRVNAEYAVQDTIPDETQEEALSSEASSRDTANSALSGSIFRGVSIPFLTIEAPAPARVAG